VLDVHKDQCVYLSDPCIPIPEKNEGIGRPPSKYKPSMKAIELQTLQAQIQAADFEEIELRNGTKGG
jgi:hypothetical protein